jgi:penicillin-binding protein 1A
MKNSFYFWRRGLWSGLSLFFFLLTCFFIVYFYAQSQLPNVESLKTVQFQVPLQIFSKDGLLIQEYGEKRRIPLSYNQIPKTLVDALIVTEDQRFFDHPGVDVFGLARATVRMVQTGTKSQGGSTITMQVARNFFLNRKKTFLRKFNEIMLAIKIDRELSKEKILELYLNKIYLGNRAYGFGAASSIYYGTTLDKLSVAQLAMLAGLPQAPSTQNPIANPAAAKKRRDHVLSRLYEEHYITKAVYAEAIKEPVVAHYHGAKIEVEAPFVAEMIRQSLYDHFGSSAYTKGYKVYTTINGAQQNHANKVMVDKLLAYDKRHGYRGSVSSVPNFESQPLVELDNILAQYPVVQGLMPAIIIDVAANSASARLNNTKVVHVNWDGMKWARPALRNGWQGRAPINAKQILKVGDIVYLKLVDDAWTLSQVPLVEGALVTLDTHNGAIETLIGGFDFRKNKFNRATQSSRQPGSSFKPFIYAAALAKGYTMSTMINDAPIAVYDPSQAGLWRPHNDTNTFKGPTRFNDALTHSGNLVSIRILDDIGIDYARDYVSRFGFVKNNLPNGLSLALGSLSASPLELATAYCVFANGGYKVEPFMIDKITNAKGKILLQARPLVVCDNNCGQDELKAPAVIDKEVAFLMNVALKNVVKSGTAHAASVLNRSDIAGKTGTTNERVDAWFAGFNGDLVTTVWVGFDTPSPLHEYAAALALPIWVDFMRFALENKPLRSMEQPKNIITLGINPKNGLRAGPNQVDTITEYFRVDNVPDLDEEYTQETSSVSNNKQEDLF